MATGKLVVEMVEGKSSVTRCFSKYPLKFIIPNKVGSSQSDAIWVYTISYGGGIVSGDSVACDVRVGNGCTAVLTTQSSTKVYKSVGSKCSQQTLEASIGWDALLVVIPDPVTCFSTAKYSQLQIFRVVPGSSLLLVDWITSGRHERGEKWAFSSYKSSNRIHLAVGDEPVFIDTVLLEQGNHSSISERLQDYQAVAMIVLMGPKLKCIQNQIQENVKNIMSRQLNLGSSSSGNSTGPKDHLSKPSFIASCSVFGPKGMGIVVRVASTTTESIYKFLQKQLAGMETLIGVSPYQ